MKCLTDLIETKTKGSFLVGALAGLLVTFSSLLVQAEETVRAPSYSYAVELYRSGKVSAAYGRFRLLANAGNSEAAKIALFMLRNGEVLYGTAWSATPAEISHWLALIGDHSGLGDVGSGD